MPQVPDPLDAANLATYNREQGVRLLAAAIIKIAPNEAQQIAQRWEQLRESEQRALDDFLAVLRAP
jgi:hypothetical protein